jgi:hypothetical protein
MIVGPRKAEQYLADMGAIPVEYLEVDLTEDETLTDTESQDEKEPIEQPEEEAEPTEAAKQYVTPDVGILRKLTKRDAAITPEDIDRANRRWDALYAGTEYVGLLDARVEQ